VLQVQADGLSTPKSFTYHQKHHQCAGGAQGETRVSACGTWWALTGSNRRPTAC